MLRLQYLPNEIYIDAMLLHDVAELKATTSKRLVSPVLWRMLSSQNEIWNGLMVPTRMLAQMVFEKMAKGWSSNVMEQDRCHECKPLTI